MDVKRKIIAILVVFLLIFIQFSIVEAGENSEEEIDDENILVEIATVNSDGTFSIKEIALSESQIAKLELYATNLIEKIQSAASLEDILNILNDDPIPDIPFLGTILRTLLSKFSLSRGFVVSSGHSYKLNPIKKSSIKIRKRIAMWHYSSSEMMNDRTIILKPLKLQFRMLKGPQIGLMTKFTGIYIFISRSLPQKSYTFFIGTAKHINGLQLPSIN